MLLYGGSFDPPHRWHIRVAGAAARRVFGRDGWVVFVPAARSPLKGQGPEASAQDRVRMLRLATRGMKNARIWMDEVDRSRAGEPSYTIDTVDRISRVLPKGMPVRLLIGADQAARFHLWREWGELFSRATPVVVWRPPISTERALRAALRESGEWTREGEAFWASLVAPAPVDPMSSTSVRALLRGSAGAARELRRTLDPAVLGYIREHGLYAEAAKAGRRGR